MKIPDLRAKITKELGYTTLLGSAKAYLDLSQQEQVNVTFGMMKYIVANQGDFPAQSVATAKRYVASGNPPLADTSFGASVKEFGAAFAEEVEKKTTIGGNVLKNALYLAVIVGVAIYFLKKK